MLFCFLCLRSLKQFNAAKHYSLKDPVHHWADKQMLIVLYVPMVSSVLGCQLLFSTTSEAHDFSVRYLILRLFLLLTAHNRNADFRSYGPMLVFLKPNYLLE